MRALLGLDPDDAGKGALAAENFEAALGFFGIDFALRLVRGPGSPWRRLMAARAVLDRIVYEEIERRRAAPDSGRLDILSLLVAARGEHGERFTDTEIRDQVMTLMFAGHDTSTSTLTFMMYELARHPEVLARLFEEQERVLGGAAPSVDQLEKGLPYLEMVLDEVLRLYPPAWIGPRRAGRAFTFDGRSIPRGALLNYSSWASHRLPDVWEAPQAFRPERFGPEERKRIPRGAYVPFGGGSRICLGMRFGQLEIRTIAARVLRNFRLELRPDFRMAIRQTPTLGPRAGLPMVVKARE